MPSIFDFSTTAASNTTVDAISIAEGMSPANLNNALRSTLAIIRQTFATALQNFLAGTASLPIANGGTAAATAPLALASLGGLSSTYRDLVLTAKTAAFTFADADSGKGVRYNGAAATATINPFSTTPIVVGATIPIRNAASSTGALTVAPGSGVTLRIAGSTATVASAAFAAGSFGGIHQETQDVWIAYGQGVS